MSETSIKEVEQEEKLKHSQPNVPQLLNLRDMAAQAALNFAGQTISSYDGTYDLLIDCIYDVLLEVAQSKDMVVEKVYLVGQIKV